MESLIPGFEYDIFISYRQKDNKHDGWVTEFVNNLKGELESTFKEEISVYFDINPHDGLLETHDVDESLKDKLKCLVFIPIISRTYCDPKSFAWEHEFKAFVDLASQDQFGLKVKLPNGNVASRVLPVHIHELDTEDIKLCESVLGGILRGIEFIYKSAGVNRPLRPNEEHPQDNLNKTYYRDQINKVANAVRGIITALKKQSQQSKEVSKQEYEVKPVSLKNQRTKIIFGSVIVLVLIVIGYFIIPKLINPKEQIEKSIAVLPFINESSVDSNKYFINGIMEEVLNNLQAIKDFRVLSRTSTDQYKGLDRPTIPEIAKKLEVNYIVEGSGQKYGNTFRLRVQLIKAKGKEDHLWAKSYEQEIKWTKDIFNIQSQIAQAIATELKTVITPAEKQLIEKIPTTSLDAFYFCQKGKEELSKYIPYGMGSLISPSQRMNLQSKLKTNNEVIANARKMFNKALKYDSTFAQAYVGIARGYWLNYGTYLDSVLILCNKALTYDQQLSEAYLLRGAFFNLKGNVDRAVTDYEHALKINPNSWEVYFDQGIVYYGTSGNIEGDFVKVIDNLQKAASLNHSSELAGIKYSISGAFRDEGFIEKSKDIALEVLKLDDDSLRYFILLGRSEIHLNNLEKALELFKKAYTIDSTNTSVLQFSGEIYFRMGKWEEALKYLKLYYAKRPEGTVLINLGYAYLKNGYEKEAENLFAYLMRSSESHIKQNPQSISHYRFSYYILASIYAIRGDKEKSLENLNHVNQLQILPIHYVERMYYPWFDFIRDDPEFKKIVSELEAKFQAEHERVRKWLEENNML